MQKTIFLLILYAVLFLLAACEASELPVAEVKEPEAWEAAPDSPAGQVIDAGDDGLYDGFPAVEQLAAVDETLPLVGAWRTAREVLGDDDGEEYRLAMLPRVPPPGMSFAVYDYDSNRVICCMRTEGEGLDGNYLKNVLGIQSPVVWDLLNFWWEDERGRCPSIVKLTIEGDLVSYKSKDWNRPFGDDTWTFNVKHGALLLPVGSRVVGTHVS